MSTSVVYFIQAGNGPIKIGVTNGNPLARMANLQTGCPEALKLVAYAPGTAQDERDLHARFAHLRLRGEWFSAKPELVEFVRGVRFATRGLPPLELPQGPTIGGLCVDDLDRIAMYVVVRRLVQRIENAVVAIRDEPTKSAIDELSALLDELCDIDNADDSDTSLNDAKFLVGQDRISKTFWAGIDVYNEHARRCRENGKHAANMPPEVIEENDITPEVH